MATLRYDDESWRLLVGPPKTEDGRPECMPRRTARTSPEAQALGLVPFEQYPDSVIDYADVPKVIEHCHKEKIFPVYHLEKYLWNPTDWYQDGLGYCWAYGLTATVMLCRAAECQPTVRLSPTSLGWLVKWRNQGYYCDAAIAGAKERGIAPVDYCPELVLNTGKFKPGWDLEAKKYRPLEWWDLYTGRDTKATICQATTILATGRALYVAYNWWGHALCCVGIKWENNGAVWQLWNSHGDGVIEISGSRGIPDEAYGIRASSFGLG